MRLVVVGLGVGALIAAVLARAGLLGALTGRVPRADRQALEQLTKEELYELAREADIRGRSSMSKPELIEALRRMSIR